MRDPVVPHPCQHWVLSVCFILAVLIDAQWYFIMALICLSLMAIAVEHVFICLFVICISSLVKCTNCCPFLNGIICFRTVEFRKFFRTSLVVQWLRIHLPVQGTWVRSLVQEDPTCRGATKPMRHNYWACALEPASHNYWAHEPQLLKPMCLEPMLCNKRSHCNEKPTHHNEE